MNDVAGVDLPNPCDTIEGCRERGVAQLRARELTRRLVRFDLRFLLCDQGALRVDLLLCLSKSANFLVTLQITLAVGKKRRILRLFANRLVELSLVETGI